MITFIANDFGPSTALQKVMGVCQERGMTSECYFRSSLTPEVKLEEATILVSGMAFSADTAEQEIRLIKEASERGIPVILYADTWGCAERSWFTDVRNSVDMVWVVDKNEQSTASVLYPAASVVVTGNPLWQEAALQSRLDPEVRARLGLDTETPVVLLVCRKEASINLPLIEVCGEAVSMFEIAGRSITRIACVHPSAPSPEQYEIAFEKYGFLRTTENLLDLLSIASVVVNAASGTGVEAIYMRRPVLEYSAPVVLDEVERLHYSRVWMPVGYGAALPFTTSNELLAHLSSILGKDPDVLGRLEVNMGTHFPIPRKQELAVQTMCEHIERTLTA